VTGIGDEQAIGLLISQNFPWKSERQVTDAGAFQGQTQRLLVQFAARAKLCSQLIDRLIDGLIVPSPGT
jgi:hypothetical protein